MPLNTVILVIVVLVLLGFRVVQQYQRGIVLRFGKFSGMKEPGLSWIVPFIDRLLKVDMRLVTLPIPPQNIITKDNVTISVSGVAYFHVTDPVKAVLEVASFSDAVNQIAQTTLRNIIGQSTLDEVLSSRDKISDDIKVAVDQQTGNWGVNVTLVAIKDIELPQGMQRAMAKQAEAEREKRAKVITAEGEKLSASILGEAADVMALHPIALQLRNLQVLTEIAAEKNSTIVFPSQFMTTVDDVRKFIAREHGDAAARS